MENWRLLIIFLKEKYVREKFYQFAYNLIIAIVLQKNRSTNILAIIAILVQLVSYKPETE